MIAWTMRCVLVIMALPFAVTAPRQVPGPQAASDAWAPLRFLVGQWQTTTHGRPGNGTGHREYRFVLRDHFIEGRNITTYPPQRANPKGEVHEDVAVISYDERRNGFVFRQFHSEGFVNTYFAAAAQNGDVVFTSETIENISPGWRARETYRRVSADEFVEIFELAEPGNDFAVYSEARMKRDH